LTRSEAKTTPTFFLDQDVVWVGDEAACRASVNVRVFSMDEVAERFDISHRALRHYEAMGLIRPQRAGSERSYTESDCNRIAFLIKDRRLASTLFEIGQLVHTGDRDAPIRALAVARDKCAQEIVRLQGQRDDIDVALIDLRRIQTILTSKIGGGA
jgi:DNA-binding transcriptional MerR regulator